MLIALLLAAPALACGQTTHIWTAFAGMDRLPAGELRDFVHREELRPMLVHGTMFPDGGYAVGDDYGEMAHWEPLQAAYLDWIEASYDPPYTGEAAEHVAFLLGMAAHGIGDQSHDAQYLLRAKERYDAASNWQANSADTATDVVFASVAGAREVPSRWVPTDALLPLFAAQGHEVDADTIGAGQAALGLAVFWVGEAGKNPETVAEYAAQFPWATGHIRDVGVPGSAPCVGELVARHWEVWWARLHDQAEPGPIVRGYPPSGPDGPDAMVSIVLARGLDPGGLGAIEVTDASGATVEVSRDLYYGVASNVVNLRPVAGSWGADAFTVSVGPGLETWDGEPVPEGSWSFSTLAERAPEESQGGCATAPGPAWAGLLAAAALWRRRARFSPSA